MPRIAICAPSTPFTRDDAARVTAVVAAQYPGARLDFHEQCFAIDGHFAGRDDVRLAALLDCANDPAYDAVWFARGGYGAVRIAEDAVKRMAPVARGKRYLGYSDAGVLLAALYRARIGLAVHAPMPTDIRREGGEAAVLRVLAYLREDFSGLEPSIDFRPTVAFNLMTLAMLVGTDLLPDLSGHVVMVEEVAEHLYAVDRLLFHVTAHLAKLGIAGLRLGRVSDVPVNDRPFGAQPDEIVRYWCERTGVPYLGGADIGHDSANRIVPFGVADLRH